MQSVNEARTYEYRLGHTVGISWVSASKLEELGGSERLSDPRLGARIVNNRLDLCLERCDNLDARRTLKGIGRSASGRRDRDKSHERTFPMTPTTLLPQSFTPSSHESPSVRSHCAVWSTCPRKSRRLGMSGHDQRLRVPTARKRISAVSSISVSPCRIRNCHFPVTSSHDACMSSCCSLI